MRRDLEVRRIQICSGLLGVLRTDLRDAGHNGAARGHVDLVNVTACVVGALQAALRQLTDGRSDRLTVTDRAALDLQDGVVQRPVIHFCRRQHCPPCVHQKAHRSGQVAEGVHRLRADGVHRGCPDQYVRLCDVRQRQQLRVILLVAQHNVSQQLVQLLLTDARRLLDCLLNFRQLNAMRPQGFYVLHSHFVQLPGQLQAAAYLVQQRLFQRAVQLGEFFGERI